MNGVVDVDGTGGLIHSILFSSLSHIGRTTQFNRKHGANALACAEDGCKAGVKEVGYSLAKQYEDVNDKDQLSRIQGKVDGVREQMQVNITRKS